MLVPVLAVALVAGACSSDDGEDAASTTTVPEVTGVGFDGIVQYLLTIDGISTVNEAAEEIDLTDTLLAAVQDDLAGPVDLTEDITFREAPLLAPTVVGEGGVRDDVNVLAGVSTTPEGEFVTVLVTPDSAETQLEGEDALSIDVSLLDDVEVGDPMFNDFTVTLSVAPEGGGDEAIGDPAALFAERAADGRVFPLGEPDASGEVTPIHFTDQASQIEEGSDRHKILYLGAILLALTIIGINKLRPEEEKKPETVAEKEARIAAENAAKGTPKATGKGTGTSGREPHLMTFDGVRYDSQLVGEFVAARTEAVEVQTRQSAFRDTGRASTNTAVAVGVGEHRLTYDAPSDELRIDGEIVDRTPGESIDLDGTVVDIFDRIIDVVTPDGDIIQVRIFRPVRVDGSIPDTGLDIYVSPERDSRTWEGLFGNPDGDPSDDLVTRDGEVLERSIDNGYAVAESWRITDEESLFDYGDGESTETFTDLDYPSERVTVDDLDPDIRTRAEAVCAAAGLSEPAAVEDCVFDYGITGSTAFIESAQQFQAFLLGQRAFNLPGSEWTGKIDGATLEGDTTANDELYLVPTADGDDNLALHALDVAGGSTRWTAPDVEPGCRPAFLPVGDIVAQLRNGTPTAGDGPNSDLVVLDQNTGEILDRWEVPEGEPALARCSPGHITTSNEGMVVLNDPGGLVRAFTTADGLALAWSVDTGASAPALPIVGDSAYVLAREDGNAVVKRLSLADGSVESSVTLEATDIERTATGLTVTEGGVAVLTRSPDGVTYVEDDDGELSEVWTVDLTDPDEPLDGRFTQLATLYDLLVGWTGTTVVALSIEDGSVAWGYEPGRGPSTNGAVAASPDVGAVVGTVGGNFLEFISATGELEVAIEGIEGVSEAMTIGPIVNRATLVAARSTGDDRSVIVASVID